MSSRLSLTQLASHTLGPVSLLILALIPVSAFGQGCVIARGGGGAMVTGGSGFLEEKHWQLNVAHRWFESDRHFVGNDEQKQRKANGTEVINNSHYLDLTATYAWSKRLNLSVTLPFVYHDRSSLYEHLGNASGKRFHTQSSGLADMRVSASYWLLNPEEHHRGNVSIGFGIKAPTGDFKATDTFIRAAGPTIRYVDSSIQPGDGGWGYSAELQGFFHLKGNWTAYGTAFYLFNPKERIVSTGFSVPDSYMARGGVEFAVEAVHGLSLSLGGRIEGVPGNDAFGGSRGSRRPGFVVAVEPGVTFTKGRLTGTLTIPVAVHRNRTTTFGSLRAGDAAFADFSINSSITLRF
jgi:hypothetical protein